MVLILLQIYENMRVLKHREVHEEFLQKKSELNL